MHDEPQKLGNVPLSPLQSVLAVHADQIAKLGELVGQLSERLVPVRNILPQAESTVGDNMPSSSPVVDLILHKTEEVKYLQGRISEILKDLEV